MASKVAEVSPTAPAHPSPLNPRASMSPTRTSLERSSAERTSLDRPIVVSGSLLGQIAANVHPVEFAPGIGGSGGGGGSSSAARPQPSLREALGRVRAGLGDGGSAGSNGSVGLSPTTAGSGGGGPLSPLSARAGVGTVQQQQQQQQQRHQTALDRTDAVWAEMQQTLRDVELTAGVGTHFFGRGHPTALEELRGAQIALAQAWARGASDTTTATSPSADPKDKDKADKKEANHDADSQKSPGASASEADADETEADMAAARRRREASDRYFERVSKHVGEVTRKLEDVAVAMGKVEEESREGWSESDTLESASQTS